VPAEPDVSTPTDADDRLRQAKQPTSVVTGPYGHPFHPMLVTIPIGAWVISFAFDVLSRVAEEGFVYARGAYWLILIGVVGAVAAAVTGTLDLLGVARGTRAWRTGVTHLVINDTVIVFFVVSFLLRRSDNGTEPASVGLLILSGVALALLAVSGWLGGKLAYTYGVRVATEQDQARGFVDEP
jgi:uncharacterized membrane protein